MVFEDYMESGMSVGELQPESGLLIVFEGGDGTGKGEMIQRTREYLSNLRVPTIVTKDPGGTPLGQSVRQLLFVDPSTKNMAPGVCDLLFLASHLQNYHTVVKPHLDAGGVVVSDRWWYSQFTYSAHRYCIPEIAEAYKKYHGPRADLLFFLHGDAETCLARANGRRVELHQSGKAWNNIEDFKKVQQTYFDMFEKLPEFRSIRADRALDDVWGEVRLVLDRFFAVHAGEINDTDNTVSGVEL